MASSSRQPSKKNWLEWLVFGLSLAVIGATVVTLIIGTLAQHNAPARLEVLLGDPREERGGFVVPVVVRNSGGRPAAAVRVEVALEGAGFSERSGFDLSYSPAGSVRQGEVTFSRDPRQGATLRPRVPGFELP